jgi:glycosyltransferase involved in cell wall biosynthesis
MADKQTRLFVDAHCFDAEYQGSRTFLQEIYALLIQKRDILFFLAAHNTDNLEKVFPPADNLVYVKYRSRSAFLRLSIEIPWLIKRHRISIAHFQYITPLFKNCKQIVTIHDVIFRDYPNEFSRFYRLKKQYLYQRSTQKAERLTTVSTFSQQSIQHHLLAAPKEVHLIPNGIHARFFESYEKREAKDFIQKKYGINQFILYVSRLEPRKNHVAVLKAFLELKLYTKGYQLVFIGHTSISDRQLQSLIVSMPGGAKGSLFLLTQVDDEDLLQFYRAADVFVYLSKAEGFGIPPLEAGAARVPVICSDASAMQEFSFFKPFHVDPFNYEEVKNKLMEAVSKPCDALFLEQIAAKIRSRYCWETSAEKLYQLIKSN